MKYSKYLSLLLSCAAFLAAPVSLSAGALDQNGDGEINILILGSTASYSDGNESGVLQEKAFNPNVIDDRLKNILQNDSAVSETVNVIFKDIHTIKTDVDTAIGGGGSTWVYDYHCYSLMQYFVWPDGKATRMTDLRGEGTGQDEHAWDYIVLCEDPYVMANFPGVYAEGVKMIQSEVAKSSNTTSGQNPTPAPPKVVLLAQWPEDTNPSSFNAMNFDEIAYRVGNSAGLTVVPAGEAWKEYNSKDTNTAHPTPRGQYLAAAAIYSTLCDKSATSTSSYNYTNGGSGIASHVWSVVQENNGQYNDKYTTENAFQMQYYRGRQVDWNEYGTSTEEGFANGLKAAYTAAKVSNSRRNPPASGNPVDLSYSRGSDIFEPDKQYKVNAAMYDRVHGFPMGDHRNTGAVTMIYGIDKRYGDTGWFGNGTDLGVAYSMIREGEIPQNVRGIPVRLMWAKINHFQPTINSHRDGWHLSNELDRAVGAYLYTTISGRCPVEAEPADNNSTEWKQWWCRKLGYETAWQMAHITTRAPGFRVCPSSAAALTVTPTTTETMTVQFVNPPQSDVTVNISISNTNAAIVGPQKLVFTPQNYNTPQNVVVAGVDGAAASEDFDVVFSTVSLDDQVYNGLSDSWKYTINRSSTQSLSSSDKGITQITAYKNTPVTVSLNTSGANSGNTTFAGPNNGVLTWSGSDVIYTPNNEYVGADGFAYAVNNGGILSQGYIEIDVLNASPNGTVFYNGNSSTSGAPPIDGNTYANGATVTVLGNTGSLVKTGHSFSGWNTAADGNGTAYIDGATFTIGTAGVLLYAQWTPDTYTITYSANGATSGDVPSDQMKTFAVDINVANNTGNLALNGAQFVGWNTAANGSGQSFAEGATFTIEQNTTLYAEWSAPPTANAGVDQTIDFSGSQAWDPSAISPEAWYDASDASTITASSGAVSQWKDKSLNNRHATAAAGSEPTSGTNTQGGLNVVTFNGSSDFMSLNLDYLAGVSHSAFILTKTTHYSNIYGAANASSGSGSLHIGFRDTNAYRMNYWGNDWYGSISNGTGGNFKVGQGNILNYIWTHNTSKQIYANGFSEGTNGSAGSITAMAGGGRLGRVTNHNFYGGDIAEIVFMTGSVLQADRERMEGYLAHKWGVTGNLDNAHPYKTNAPTTAGAGITLAGSANDPDGDQLTYSWTVVSGSGNVNFINASSLTTDVSFDQADTYVLRLTVDDGTSQITDDVEITVNPPLSSIYTTWASGHALNDIGMTLNGDGDDSNNMLEFAFGTDPTVNDSGPLASDGSVNGQPVPVSNNGGVTFDFFFVRRDDYGTSGSLIYTPQFSSDLVTFYDSEDAPILVSDSTDDPSYQVVKVPYPATLPNGQKATYGRIMVSVAP